MKYHCIRQHDVTDCGAACLATICRQNGYKIGITRIREIWFFISRNFIPNEDS